MSQQSGINQFHVAQFLPIRKNMRCCAARHIYSAARRLMFAGSTEVYLPYIFTNICFSTHASTQCTQPTPQTIRSRRYDAALGTVEEKGSGEGGADEDGDDFDWIQMLVCSLVLLQCTSMCFHLVRCFYRLTDWTGLLCFFSSKRSLCDGALGSDYCQRPQQVPAVHFITAQRIQQRREQTNSMLCKNDSLLWIYSKRSCMELRAQQSHVEETSSDCLLCLSPVLWAFWLVGISSLISSWFPLNRAFPRMYRSKTNIKPQPQK